MYSIDITATNNLKIPLENPEQYSQMGEYGTLYKPLILVQSSRDKGLNDDAGSFAWWHHFGSKVLASGSIWDPKDDSVTTFSKNLG